LVVGELVFCYSLGINDWVQSIFLYFGTPCVKNWGFDNFLAYKKLGITKAHIYTELKLLLQ